MEPTLSDSTIAGFIASQEVCGATQGVLSPCCLLNVEGSLGESFPRTSSRRRDDLEVSGRQPEKDFGGRRVSQLVSWNRRLALHSRNS